MLSHGNINAGVAGIQVQYEVCVRKIEVTDSALKRGEEGGKGGEMRERGVGGCKCVLG